MTDDAKPGAAPREWRKLPGRVKRVWALRGVVYDGGAIVVCAALAGIFVASDWWGLWQGLVLGAVAAVAALDLATQPLQTRYAYAFTMFSIGERDLKLRKGWMFRKSITVPFNRVQHVDTKQGPILRRFGLTAVIVHTAVDSHDIEALDQDEAARVIDLITARVLNANEDL